MKIPFKDFVVTSFDLRNIKTYENYNFIIENNVDHIFILFKHSIPAPLYYFQDTYGYRYYSFDEELLHNFLIKHCGYYKSIETDNPLAGKKLKSDVAVLVHKHLCLQSIKMYRYIKIYLNYFECKHIDNLFSVDIINAGDIIKEWVNRYTELINSFDNDTIISADLSSGLDTRSLTYFWKNCDKNIQVYTKLTEDGENLELYVAKDIVQYINDKYNKNIMVYTQKLGNTITISGKGADLYGIELRLHSTEYLYGYLSIKTWKHYFFNIMPYCDITLLQIRTHYAGLLKHVLQVLLAEEFIGKFPYYTFDRQEFKFTDDIIRTAKNIIKMWDIKKEDING